MQTLLLLWVVLARGADGVDTSPMGAWRGEVHQLIGAAVMECSAAHPIAVVAFDARVDSSGALTLEPTTMSPNSEAFIGCVKATATTVGVPLGGRGVSLVVRIPGVVGPTVWVGPPRFDPPALDSDEVQLAIAEVIGLGEQAVWQCMPPGAPSLSVTWVCNAATGLVASVSPVESVGEAQSACVRNVIVRWTFPPFEAADGTVVVNHTFEREQRSPGP